jgi:hypothetical protein
MLQFFLKKLNLTIRLVAALNARHFQASTNVIENNGF